MNALQINNTKKAVNIVKEYIPSFFNSDSYKWDILEVIMNNKDWANDLINFVDAHKDSRTMIIQTMMHDIGGLMRNDEHFLPRI